MTAWKTKDGTTVHVNSNPGGPQAHRTYIWWYRVDRRGEKWVQTLMSGSRLRDAIESSETADAFVKAESEW